MTALVRHSWPGNVRELQNFIERSVILSTGAVLSGSLPEHTGTLKLSGAATLNEAERSHIIQTLQRTEVWSAVGMAQQRGWASPDDIDRQDEAAGNPSREDSASRVQAASVPMSEDPLFRIPPLGELTQGTASAGDFEPQSGPGRVFTLVDAEREHISEVVEMTNGMIAGEGGAAEMLGVPPSTLRSRMKKLGIK